MSKYDGPMMPDSNQDNSQANNNDWSTEPSALQSDQSETTDTARDERQSDEATPPAYIPATESYYNNEKSHNKTARKILIGAVAVCAIAAGIGISVATSSPNVSATNVPSQTSTEATTNSNNESNTSTKTEEVPQPTAEQDGEHDVLTVDELKQITDSNPDRVADDNNAYGETLAKWMYTNGYGMYGPNYKIVNDDNQLVPEATGLFGFNDDSVNEVPGDNDNTGNAYVEYDIENSKFKVETRMSTSDIYNSDDRCYFTTDKLPDMEGLGEMVREELESR